MTNEIPKSKSQIPNKSQAANTKALPPGMGRGALMSGREVRAVTGWTEPYLRKLRDAGAIWSWTPRNIKHAWPWYNRAEIEGIVNPKVGLPGGKR